MALVLQIVVVLIVLVGLITTIMSVKNWHWAQMLLLLSIFFASLGVLFLGMEVFRIHRNLRAGMPAKIAKIEAMEEVNEAYIQGTRDAAVISRAFAADPFAGTVPYDEEAEGRMPGMGVWRSRIQDLARDRGRVWRDVKAAGPVDAATGRIPVTLPAPRPHGLEKDAILFAFEQGPPNPAAADQGRQYLGEFRVVEVREDGATLESVQKLDQRTGGRLVRSATNPQIAWRLYETMPSDRHEVFAGIAEEDLKKLLPAATINEYLRHGKEATPDDDEYHRAAFNDQGQRVALTDAAKVKELYDRTLRDYAYMFSELLRQKTLLIAEAAGLTEDNNRLKGAQENALKLTAHRQKELKELEVDRKFMERDRQTIEKLLTTVQAQLNNARQLVADLLPANAQQAQQYIASQIAELESGPTSAPAISPLTGAQP